MKTVFFLVSLLSLPSRVRPPLLQMQGSNFLLRQGRSYFTGDRRRGSGSLRNSGCLCKFFMAAILVAVPAYLYTCEVFERNLELALADLASRVVEVPDTNDVSSFPSATGTPVFFSSPYTGSSADADFGVSLESALLLNRETQYCQWQEISSEVCQTCRDRDGDSYSCNCVTTYLYNKGWHNYRIPSIFFDQPFNHNNPQRDPFPSATLPSESALAGELHLLPELLLHTRATPRRVLFLRPGQQPPSYSFWKFFGWKDNQRYENTDHLTPLLHSPAYVDHNFVYTGEEGWFFSAYEASTASELLKKMGQFLEGSLFDWQLADLFGGCTAGDIRVRYSVIDPQEVSVLGLYHPTPTPRVGLVDTFVSETVPDSFTFGAVAAGRHSFKVRCVACVRAYGRSERVASWRDAVKRVGGDTIYVWAGRRREEEDEEVEDEGEEETDEGGVRRLVLRQGCGSGEVLGG